MTSVVVFEMFISYIAWYMHHLEIVMVLHTRYKYNLMYTLPIPLAMHDVYCSLCSIVYVCLSGIDQSCPVTCTREAGMHLHNMCTVKCEYVSNVNDYQ